MKRNLFNTIFCSLLLSLCTSSIASTSPLIHTEKAFDAPKSEQYQVVEYRIQFLTVAKKLDKNSPEFKGLTDVSSYSKDGIFNYTYGSTLRLDEAQNIQKEVSNKFPDCFIVKFKDGNRIGVVASDEVNDETPTVEDQSELIGPEGNQAQQSYTSRSVESGVVEYRIQFLTATRLYPNGSRILNGLGNSHYIDNGIYKYTYGSTADPREATQIEREIRNKFPQAFVVKFRNDRRIGTGVGYANNTNRYSTDEPFGVQDRNVRDRVESQEYEPQIKPAYQLELPSRYQNELQPEFRTQNEKTIEYRVLFLTSAQKLPPTASVFTGLSDISYYIENGLFKYTTGFTPSKDVADGIKNNVSARFPSCTIVAFIEGNRIKDIDALNPENANSSTPSVKKENTNTTNTVADASDTNQTNSIQNTVATSSNDSSISPDDIEYRVEFMSSYDKIPSTSDVFKGIPKVTYRVENNMYKYTSGSTTSLAEALEIKRKLDQRFNNCTITRFQNGVVIDN